MTAPPLLIGQPSLVRRIAAAIKRAVDQGLRAKSIYLNAVDLAEFKRVAPAQWRAQAIGGLDVRRTCQNSILYCHRGVGVTIPKTPPAIPRAISSIPSSPAVSRGQP